jgi:hypothetical protein
MRNFSDLSRFKVLKEMVSPVHYYSSTEELRRTERFKSHTQGSSEQGQLLRKVHTVMTVRGSTL